MGHAIAFVGQLSMVVGVVLVLGYRAGRGGDTRPPESFAARDEESRRRRLVHAGIALAVLGVAAQLADQPLFTVWG